MRAGIATFLVLLVFSGIASAQEGGDVWVQDASVGLTQARFSGRAAVLVFSAGWCGYCEHFEKFFLDAKAAPVSRKTVLVLLDVEGNAEVMRKFEVEGHHKAVVLAWDGTVLARLDYPVEEAGGPEKLLETFRQAVCANEISAAEVLFKVDRFAKAVERAEGVLELLKEGDSAERARKLIEETKTRAEQALASARELLKKGQLGDCVLACDALSERFPAKMVGAEVKKIRRGIEQAQRGRPVTEGLPAEPPEVVVAKQAQDLVDRGMVLEWNGEYYQATLLYEQALRDFPGQKSTDDAWARLKALRENAETVNLIKKQEIDTQCKRLMQMAAAYVAGGHVEEARQYYERVIREQPESEWAKAAKDALDKLKK